MSFMSTGFSGLTPAQSDLVQHWQSCRNGIGVPTREALNPGAIRVHLSAISMVEVDRSGDVLFRLAGSGLRQLFGREMRGRRLYELPSDLTDMWSLGLSAALERQEPVGGLIEREDDTHSWLRLPLQPTVNGALVLCHDAILPKLQRHAPSETDIHVVSNTLSVLAA